MTKILGINKNTFKSKEGKDVTYYSIYMQTGDASEGGCVVRDYHVNSSALVNACKQVKATENKQLVGREVDNYQLSKGKFYSTVTLINMK